MDMDKNMLLALLMVVTLWYMSTKCAQHLSNHIPKKTIFILSSIIYAIIISIYAYHNIHECYEHIVNMNVQIILILVLMALITSFSGFCTIYIT